MVSVAVTALPASADTIYTNQATFLADLNPTYYLETFTTASHVELGVTASFGPSNGYSFTASNADGISIDQAIGGGYLTPGANGNSNTAIAVNFTASPTPVTAFGANFFDNNSDYSFGTGDLTIVLSDSTTVSITGAAVADFRGFSSAVPIASFSVTATTPGLFSSLDNLYVGSAVAAVPTPTSALGGLALIGGLGLVTGSKRLRNQMA